MKRRTMNIGRTRFLVSLVLPGCLVCLGACGAAVSPASAQPPATFSQHPDNPHYFLWRGRPAILITSAEHYGAVLNADFDYVKYLGTLARDGLNLTRTFTGGAYFEPAGAFKIASNTLAPASGRFMGPWARSDQPGAADGGYKHDLARWNDAYFARLRDFVAQASRRGIVVEVNLFCPFYKDDQWKLSPFNLANNINGLGNVARTNVYTLDQHGGLLGVQERMVRKFVDELRDFDNVYYEICNEPYFGGVTLDWQRRIADVIADAQKNYQNKKLISQNIANKTARVRDPHPAVSILNFHYTYPPAAVAENYALARVIGENETGFRGTRDEVYRVEAWDFIIAGGGLFNHLDYSFTVGHEDGTFAYPPTQPGGGGVEFRRQLGLLRDFISRFDFVKMEPADELVRAGRGDNVSVRVLGEPGRQYALYIHNSPMPPWKDKTKLNSGDFRVNLALDAPAATYQTEWIEPATGKVLLAEPKRHAGGPLALSSPRYTQDVALRLTVAAPQLRVSDNRRFLMDADGKPFFYLGDTAWELFHCLTREEADLYLRTRSEQQFTVIQAVVLAEFDGLRLPNAYGHLPLRNDDPTQPVEEYFQHVDWVTRRANELGLWVGMLPTWGDKWNKRWGKGPEIFTPQNARAYGEWLARRYRDAKIIWILGGDRAIETNAQREVIRAMAEGLRAGDGGAHLITYHPSGGKHSADMVHDEPWLDFNMIQSGHGEKNIASYDKITLDYTRTPTKPCMDGEPCYENHPVRRKKEQGWFDQWDARKLCYWALFAGAHGHTYGCHDIWSFHDPAKNRRFVDQRTAWQEAIHLPGANQMRYARALIESRPFLTRIPDQSLIVGDTLTGADHLQAARDSAGSCAMVYSPSGRPFKVRLDKISGSKVKVWWFDPRKGEAAAVGEFANTSVREFTPPTSGEGSDWVLVMDDFSKNYPSPGQGTSLAGSASPSAGPAGYKVVNVGTRPESVTKGFGGHYYVTVMGDQQPGDAVIKVIKGDRVELFATGMDEPKGIAFVGDFLVTADLKRVWKVDAQGNKTVLAAEKDFPNPISYLNDTAAAPDGKSVFVTDMGARDKIMGPDGLWPLDSPEAKALPHIGRIYQIALDGRVRLVVDAAPEMACPNGVCAPSRGNLLIAEFFHGNLLRARNGKAELLATGFRGADGIERAKNGEIFVSSWVQGKVWKLDARGQNPTVLIEGLQSAADIYLDEPARLFLVPDMKAGVVVYVPLE